MGGYNVNYFDKLLDKLHIGLYSYYTYNMLVFIIH